MKKRILVVLAIVGLVLALAIPVVAQSQSDPGVVPSTYVPSGVAPIPHYVALYPYLEDPGLVPSTYIPNWE